MSKVIDMTSRLKARDAVVEPAVEELSEYNQETEDIVEGWIGAVLEQMEELELGDDSVEFSRDFIFMTESLRSLVYRSRGTDHFIQQVADTMIDVSYDPETDMIEGVWNFDDGPSIKYSSGPPETEEDDDE